jgi:hypothetical protein
MRTAAKRICEPLLGVLLLAATAPFGLAAEAPELTFTAEGIRLVVAGDGKVTSLVDTTTGVNRSLEATPLCVITIGGSVGWPTAYSVAGNKLTYTYGKWNPAPVVSIRVEQKPRYLVFTLEELTPATGIDEVCFVNLRPQPALDGTATRFLRFEDQGAGRCLAIYALDPYTATRVDTSATSSYLLGLAYPNLPGAPPTLTGRRAAAFTCAADQSAVYDIAGQIERDYNIPLGVAAKQLPLQRHSCIFWMDFEYNQRQQVVQYTQQAGATKILLYFRLWADYHHKCVPAAMWGSVGGLKNWIDECKAAGLTVGAHLFPSMIFKDAADYIRAGCDPRIRRDRSIALATNLPASQGDGLIRTAAPPAAWPIAPGDRDLVIDGEIIEYTGVKTAEPPYGFTGPFVRAKNQTGEGGLGPQNHLAGATIGHLCATFDGVAYRWDIASGGVEQWCADLAATADAVGFQFIYNDGTEEAESPGWYTVDLTHLTMYNALENPPLWMESAVNTGCLSWALLGIDGQTDYLPLQNGLKAGVNRNITRFATLAKLNGYIPRQLGWACLAVPGKPLTTPDELEYLLAKSIAHDLAIEYQMWMYSMPTWPNRDANLYLMSKYEQLRLDGSLSAAEKLAARAPNQEFMLFTDAAEGYHLVQTTLLNIANATPAVRGFITKNPLDGYGYVTLWPAAANSNLTLGLPGVTAADIAVKNYRGEPLQATDNGAGQTVVPLTGRVYIKLVRVPDPVGTFANAIVRGPG